jgi:hypothetical protein
MMAFTIVLPSTFLDHLSRLSALFTKGFICEQHHALDLSVTPQVALLKPEPTMPQGFQNGHVHGSLAAAPQLNTGLIREQMQSCAHVISHRPGMW